LIAEGDDHGRLAELFEQVREVLGVRRDLVRACAGGLARAPGVVDHHPVVALEIVAQPPERGGHGDAGVSDDHQRAVAALLPVELYAVR
jgi:hypothetical protein